MGSVLASMGTVLVQMGSVLVQTESALAAEGKRFGLYGKCSGAEGKRLAWMGVVLATMADVRPVRGVFGRLKGGVLAADASLVQMGAHTTQADAGGPYAQLLSSYASVELLVLDGWLHDPLSCCSQSQKSLEALDDRQDRSSTFGGHSGTPGGNGMPAFPIRQLPTRPSIAWCTARTG